jgi:uncharacterized protein (DUF302 family)
MTRLYYVMAVAGFCCAPHVGFAADTELITKQSNHSVAETIQRFEAAVNASAANGWMVFTEIDYRSLVSTTILCMLIWSDLPPLELLLGSVI